MKKKPKGSRKPVPKEGAEGIFHPKPGDPRPTAWLYQGGKKIRVRMDGPSVRDLSMDEYCGQDRQ